MIRSLTINNYKAFGQEDNELLIRPITIVVGKNNSGKSSILKLLSILASMSDGSPSGPILLRNEAVSLGGRFQDLFHDNDTSMLTLGIKYEGDTSLKFFYLMNEGKLFCKIQNNKDNNATTNFLQNNPFETLLTTLKENPYEFSVDYIGPLRKSLDRDIQIDGKIKKKLAANGENVCEILLESYLSDKTLFKAVAEWLENLDCTGLDFERNSESSGSYSLSAKHGPASVNLSDVGQGIGQVLPVIVSSFMKEHSDITIIEQPVLHLHPAAHQSVAVRIAQSAIEMNRKFLIETHSQNFILAVRDMIANPSNPLSPNDVIIYSVEQDNNESWLKKITIDNSGELSDWPEGVFSESYELIKSISRHSK